MIGHGGVASIILVFKESCRLKWGFIVWWCYVSDRIGSTTVPGSRRQVTWHCEYVSMTTDDLMCVWNDGVTLIPRSAVIPALEPTLLIDIWSPNERYSHAIGRVRRCPRRLVNKGYTHGSWGMVKPLQYMLIYMYLSIILLCSNQHCVFQHYQWLQETSRISHIRKS
jgi:hypothetical protein